MSMTDSFPTRRAAGVHLLLPTLPMFVSDGPRPGPTVWVQAGIHGDEIAGVHAVQELLEQGIRPQRGRLILIPVMNPAAYRARERAAPGGLDLNRCFPGDPQAAEPERRLASLLMGVLVGERPDLVATLHESNKRYDPAVTPSFGQSLVVGVQPVPGIIQSVCDVMNQTLLSEDERWTVQHYPVPTSSTEVIVDAIGCVGVCVETWMGFPERRRTDMHIEVVRNLLGAQGQL